MPKLIPESEVYDGEEVIVLTPDNIDDIEPQAGERAAAKRLTDTDLVYNQNLMNKTSQEMKDINDRLLAKGGDDAELSQQWDRACAVFDAAEAQVDGHMRFTEQSQKRTDRLNNMRDKTTRLPRDVRNRIGAGGRLLDADIDADDLHENMIDCDHLLGAASSAWFKAHNGQMSAITSEEKEACARMGFSPQDKDLRLPMYDQATWELARDIFDGHMEGVDRSSRGGKKARREARRELVDAISTVTPTGGPFTENYLFGTTFVADLEEAVLAYGGIYGNVDVLRTADGTPIYMPTSNDTANGGRMLTEALALPPASTALVGDADTAFGNMVLYAFIGTSDRIAVSNSLLEDNGVMLKRKLPEWLGVRIGRLKNRMGTNGLGVASSQPDGIVPQSVLGVTAAASTGIVLDEVFDLVHALELGLRENHECKFMFTDQTLKMFRKIKDSQGRYLWQVDARSGAPATLDTHQYIINQQMPQVGAGLKSVIFGNFMAYKFRDVVGAGSNGGIRLRTLGELYAESDQTAYLAFARFDGRLLNAGDNPVIHLIHP